MLHKLPHGILDVSVHMAFFNANTHVAYVDVNIRTATFDACARLDVLIVESACHHVS